MRNRRPLAVGVLCCLINTLQAQSISDSLQAQISLETPPPCKSNEYLNTVWKDCWPCAESWWWDFWPFTGHYYCLPKCTAPAVWDSTVQSCQTLTLRFSTSTLYQCQWPYTNASNPIWTSGLQTLYPGGQLGPQSVGDDETSQILWTKYSKELGLKKITTNVFDLTLQFSNGKSIKASTPITFVPEAYPIEIFDDTTIKKVNASQPFQGLNLKVRDECGDVRPLYVGPTNFSCTVKGRGYENGLKLPGPCYIEAKATKLYANEDYTFEMSYLPKSGHPLITKNSAKSPWIIYAPQFFGPRMEAIIEYSWQTGEVPYNISSGAKLSLPCFGDNNFNSMGL
ncbi:hypothetical protein FGO68_gene8131 [Halteria grandinella]|uniref:Uncharacterized protein n=1 Tax=Halteria grandinella TaxID=5974 RepID=A0A8J8T5L8_HALGN|nr:hypothetical protein FGO68_gene8131 [Halteria grandinella]